MSNASSREQLLASRKLAFQESQRAATAQLPSGEPPPKAQALRGASLNSTTTLLADVKPPSYNLHGQPLPPGLGDGVRIVAGGAGAHTASGQFRADTLFGDSSAPAAAAATTAASAAAAARPPKPKPTLSGLRFGRKMAQRADPSFDLDGDGTVSQTDFFFATRFDTDGSGVLTQEEKLEARKIMKEEEAKFVFVKGGSTTDSFAHRVMQKDGVVLSEQLEGGWAALTRAQPVTKQGELPFVVQGASGALVGGTGISGLEKAKLDIDMDDSDNVALMHTKGQLVSFDNVVVKPGYRDELSKSGAASLSDLRFKRRMAQRADPSFDLDGDGMVSQKDFFFATRFDKDGSGVLDPFEKAVAAEAMKSGFGGQFHFVRTSGPSDKNHRVQQRDGVVLSEEGAGGGYGKLAKAREDGSTARVGADGNIKEDFDAGERGGGPRVVGVSEDGKPVHEVMMTDEGRVALMHVDGVVYDYDQIPTKPQFRPGLVKSGSSTRSELLLRRRREKYPDLSMDLDGDGAVSQADYWFSKRYDVDDSNSLDPVEKAKAVKDYAEGYQKKFVTLSSSAAPSSGGNRVLQIGNTVVSDGEGHLTGRAEVEYDSTKRLPTLGAVPALDLPADRMVHPGLLTAQAQSAAGRLAETGGKPVAVGSLGVVPGVTRVVLRNPDGSQEAFGGYASGMGAGPLNNCTGTLEAVYGRTVGAGTAANDAPARDREAEDRTARETLLLQDDVPPPRQLQMTSFGLRGHPTDVWMHAPFALSGEGGAKEAHVQDAELASNKDVATSQRLLTRTQLIAARVHRSQNSELQGATAAEARAAGSATGLINQTALESGSSASAPESKAGLSGLHAGETALRSAIESTAAPGSLPAYMIRAVQQHEDLPVLRDDLPHETVKPSSLPEGVRTHEATRASALAAARKRDLKLAALEATGQAPDAVAMPELYGSEFNDHHAHAHSLVADGQDSLSKTQSQLGRRRLAERFQAALKWAPTEPEGVHGRQLPSFAKKLNSTLQPWWTDRQHLQGVRTNFEGSPISSPQRGERDEAFRDVKDYIDPVPDMYDPELRHTVRDAERNGQKHSSSATTFNTRTGLGARAPRLLASGLQHEDEGANVINDDPFKVRTVEVRKLDKYLRKHGLKLAEKPSRVDPWAIAREQRDDPAAFVPAFDVARPGGRSLHTIHKNVTATNNCLPGPKPDLTRTIQSIKAGQMWSSAVIEYRQSIEPATEHLDPGGKETRTDPKEMLPMFSSFTKEQVHFAKPNTRPLVDRY